MIGLIYYQLGYAETHCDIGFTLSDSTPYTMTLNPSISPSGGINLSGPNNAGFVFSSGSQVQTFTGTLGPGAWIFRYDASFLIGGPWLAGGELALSATPAPEPASALILATVACLFLSVRPARDLRRACVWH